jgi:hypothetical protein
VHAGLLQPHLDVEAIALPALLSLASRGDLRGDVACEVVLFLHHATSAATEDATMALALREAIFAMLAAYRTSQPAVVVKCLAALDPFVSAVGYELGLALGVGVCPMMGLCWGRVEVGRE